MRCGPGLGLTVVPLQDCMSRTTICSPMPLRCKCSANTSFHFRKQALLQPMVGERITTHHLKVGPDRLTNQIGYLISGAWIQLLDILGSIHFCFLPQVRDRSNIFSESWLIEPSNWDLRGLQQRKSTREVFWRLLGIPGGHTWKSFPCTNPRKIYENKTDKPKKNKEKHLVHYFSWRSNFNSRNFNRQLFWFLIITRDPPECFWRKLVDILSLSLPNLFSKASQTSKNIMKHAFYTQNCRTHPKNLHDY